MSQVRKEVLEHIIDVVREGDELGLDGLKYARSKLPDVPEMVVAEAWCEHEHRKIESWWQSVERTIDAEVIRNALANGPRP